MFVRGILVFLTVGAIVALLWGMVANPPNGAGDVPERVAVSSQDMDEIQQTSAPLKQHSFPSYGFSIDVPEDWRVLTLEEQRALGETFGSATMLEETIISLTPDIPNGTQIALVLIDRMFEPMDGESLSTLNTMSTVLSGLDWVSWGSWTGKSWTRVTIQPYEQEIGGYTAATMGLHVKNDGDGVQDAQMSLTFVELPREAVSVAGITTDNTFRNREVEAILASFTVAQSN